MLPGVCTTAGSHLLPRHGLFAVYEFSENMIKVTLPVITSGGDLTGDEKIIYDSMDRLGKTSSQIAKAAFVSAYNKLVTEIWA